MKSKLIFCVIILFFCSCKKNNKNINIKDNSNTKIEKKNNITTETSTEISRLQKLLDFSKFKPKNVKFKYVFIDNSGGRLPAPSDSFLEAVLYFDEKTMEEIRNIDKYTDFPNSNFHKKDFKFKWLDKNVISELESSDSLKSPHLDFIFGTENGKCWYLKNKILFKREIN